MLPLAAALALALPAWRAYAQAPPDSVAADTSMTPATTDTVAAPALAPGPSRPKRRFAGKVWQGAKDFGSDCWYVAKSPTRITTTSAAVAALVIGGEAALYANDDAILRASRQNRGEPVYDAVIDVGDAIEPLGLMAHTNPIYLGLWVVGSAFNIDPLQHIAPEILESHLIAGGIRNGLKFVVGRRHPFEDEGPRAFDFGHGTSFPSGHTSIYFELATILSHHAHFVPATVALYGVAAAGAVQRVESRSHWASDVLLPAVTGTVIARTVVRRHEQRSKDDGAKASLTVKNGTLRLAVERGFGPGAPR